MWSIDSLSYYIFAIYKLEISFFNSLFLKIRKYKSYKFMSNLFRISLTFEGTLPPAEGCLVGLKWFQVTLSLRVTLRFRNTVFPVSAFAFSIDSQGSL